MAEADASYKSIATASTDTRPRIGEVLFGKVGNREFDFNDEGTDPEVGDMIVQTHLEVKKRYGLPERGLRFVDPENYMNRLLEVADENGVPVFYRNFNDENPHGNSPYYDDENDKGLHLIRPESVPKEFANTNKTSFIGDAEHELIHALQDRDGILRSPEVMEYEAFAAANIDVKIADQRWVQGVMVNYVRSSASYFHEQHGETNPWR